MCPLLKKCITMTLEEGAIHWYNHTRELLFSEKNKARLPGVTQWRKATPNALRTQTALGSRSPPIKPTPIRGKPTSPSARRHDNKLAVKPVWLRYRTYVGHKSPFIAPICPFQSGGSGTRTWVSFGESKPLTTTPLVN
ncbi:hypothetical protein QVD17_37241 [Tagetes erecta]|uniref:Uncharacterized protein n=1 Tax=Tagetes erecta TaxID=13708 RepID=A0AAD8NJ05_TARER|nr:hypothetical protein QVD17_37241 [Tagetes erecta]